ncbi:FAD-binding protein [Streptacidiphilus sp. N1-10]|uniref:FAD-binding protein n=1 Tax=Streptacidiphilus jeojiensis TaxID=3229225 RepID=A0ABV6XRV5_9ACTN
MTELTRRHFLGTSAAGGALALAGAGIASPAAAADSTSTTGSAVAVPGEVTVQPGDPGYGYLTTRGLNRRFTGAPARINQVFTADQTRQAVQQAVDAGQQIAVRSGGHCLDALVDNPQVTALIDVSQLNAIGYDPVHQAISIQAGAQLGVAYKQLYLAYGMVAPTGSCPTVGVAGFTTGGGFGPLCRDQGLVVDHLYGVEVVTVDRNGQAHLQLATRSSTDPNRDLWWAHTGGGGGSFGVVTRFLFRSPQATGAGPAGLLPTPPKAVITATVVWPWSGLTETAFERLVANHGAWHAANSAPGTPYRTLYSEFALTCRNAGVIALVAEIDAGVPGAQNLMNSYLGAVSQGVSAPSSTSTATMNWLTARMAGLYPEAPASDNRSKSKGSYLRRPFTADQAGTLYQYLSAPPANAITTLVVYAYGGQVNSVAPAATAVAQRDSILKTLLVTAWADPADDDTNVAWTRSFYQDLHSATGGVPVPATATDGCYINFPDTDLADPAQNTSGTSWQTLYFKDNYPRLQAVKAGYDPTDQFHHPLSVRLPNG